MGKKIIDLDKLRQQLPSRAIVTLKKKRDVYYIDCFIPTPLVTEAEFETYKRLQRELLGELIMEQFTIGTGRHWQVYLKKVDIEFINE